MNGQRIDDLESRVAYLEAGMRALELTFPAMLTEGKRAALGEPDDRPAFEAVRAGEDRRAIQRHRFENCAAWT